MFLVLLLGPFVMFYPGRALAVVFTIMVITTFMIASDPYLQRFVNEFTETNQGRAFYATLDRLGSFLFTDFEQGKRRNVY